MLEFQSHIRFCLTSALQLGRLMITPAALGCKRLLGSMSLQAGLIAEERVEPGDYIARHPLPTPDSP